MVATYEVFAIRYAHLERTARHNFLGGDEHDGPMPLDYYVWAIVDAERTRNIRRHGIRPGQRRRRGRQIVRPVAEGLKAIGISPDKVEHIVISHMHYDHAGNHDLFPRARYHLQDAEMAYCTGRCMLDSEVGGVFDAGAVAAMTHKVFEGRVQFHDGDDEIAPGITVHKVGGHTRGMQVVRVSTARGWVVLGSDTAHFYANLEPDRPFPIFDDLAAYVQAQRTALQPCELAAAFHSRARSAGVGALPRCQGGTRRRGPGRPGTHGSNMSEPINERIGFIGVGRMGGAMVERLLAAGYPVTVCDASDAATRPMLSLGATRAESPAAVASTARIVFASLPTPQIVLEVVRGATGIRDGKTIRTFVDLSTSGAAAAIAIDESLA